MLWNQGVDLHGHNAGDPGIASLAGSHPPLVETLHKLNVFVEISYVEAVGGAGRHLGGTNLAREKNTRDRVIDAEVPRRMQIVCGNQLQGEAVTDRQIHAFIRDRRERGTGIKVREKFSPKL